MSPDLGRILIVEDDAGVRELVRVLLRTAGYDPHTAHDGEEALSRVHVVRPMGIILDLNMPVLDGFGVLADLRANPPPLVPRVLVLSARHDNGDVLRAVRLGAKDYLAKPFTDRQLLARVARLMRSPVAILPPPPVDDAVLL